MAYRKKTWRFPNAVEVMEYHTGRYGAPGEPRHKRAGPTPEEVRRYNRKLREMKCRHKLREHFRENDYYVTMTYAKDQRPADMEEAKKDFRNFIRQLARAYRGTGHTIKWIRNIEVGTKGAWHVHLVVNRIPDADIIIRSCWQRGRAYFELLYEKGGFRQLAAYITKTPETDPRLREAHHSSSRNLPVPEPEVKTIFRWETWPAAVRIRKDTAEKWYVDRDSVCEGVNKYGHRYRQYTLLRYLRE